MDGSGMFGMTGDEIYRNFTEGPGGNDLSSAADIASRLQAEHEQDAAEIRSLAVFMEAAWQGEAGGAAQRGAVPLAVEHELSAPLLFTDHDLFGRQVGSFDDARNRVVPVPPAPEMPPGMGILFQPGVLPTYQRQLAEHNAASESNVDVMMSYEDASSHNAESLPSSYGSLTPDTAGIRVASSPHDGVTGPRGGDDGGPGGDAGRGPAASSWLPPVSTGGDASSATAGPSAPAGAGMPPQDTRSHGYVPAPGVPAPGPLVAEPIGSGSPGPVSGFVPHGGGLGKGPGEGGPGRGPGARESGGLGGGPGGGAGKGGEGGHGVGGRAGSSPVAGGAAAEGGARGAAGARAGGGGMPMGAGSGRSRGDEDTEYQRKPYLEGGDPEALYGVGGMTAPSVIGDEDEEED